MDLNIYMEKYKNGDEKAFNKIYKETFPIIRCLIYSYVNNEETTLDICQEVYTKLDKIKNTYDGNNIFSYIYTMAKNLSIDYIKRKKIINNDIYDVAEESQNPYLKFAIANLDELEREIFLTKVLCGHTTKKLAIIYNLKVSEVNKIYNLAKKKLKNCLGGFNNELK